MFGNHNGNLKYAIAFYLLDFDVMIYFNKTFYEKASEENKRRKQAIKNKGYCGLSWVEFSMNKDETLQLNWRNSV